MPFLANVMRWPQGKEFFIGFVMLGCAIILNLTTSLYPSVWPVQCGVSHTDNTSNDTVGAPQNAVLRRNNSVNTIGGINVDTVTIVPHNTSSITTDAVAAVPQNMGGSWQHTDVGENVTLVPTSEQTRNLNGKVEVKTVAEKTNVFLRSFIPDDDVSKVVVFSKMLGTACSEIAGMLAVWMQRTARRDSLAQHKTAYVLTVFTGVVSYLFMATSAIVAMFAYGAGCYVNYDVFAIALMSSLTFFYTLSALYLTTYYTGTRDEMIQRLARREPLIVVSNAGA